jgi:hypothetical protein
MFRATEHGHPLRAMTEGATTRCPICGVGTLADIAYDAGERDGPVPELQPTSHQLETYSCGHRVVGAPLETADDRLDVERRTSDEATEPLPEP